MDETPKQAEPAEDWDTLAAAAQSGDKTSYRLLLQDISGFTRRYVVKTLANPDWADDVAQEVLLSVHRSLHTYSPGRPFRPWLMAVIHFRRTDFLRKHYKKRDHRKTSLDHPDFITTHVTNPGRMGEYKDVEGMLETLPAKQRQVFEMLKIKGYTAKDVAKETGMSVSAVKVSAHRTMKKLKEKYG